jgi:hypothetical protein
MVNVGAKAFGQVLQKGARAKIYDLKTGAITGKRR